MNDFHRLWIAQCDAAQEIRERFGVQKALGYLIGEKLLGFVRACESEPALAAELPAFVARIRGDFEPHELAAYFDGVRRVGAAAHTLDEEQHEAARAAGMFGQEDVVSAAEDVLRMGRMKTLLLD